MRLRLQKVLATLLVAVAAFGCTQIPPTEGTATGAEDRVDPLLDTDKDGVPDEVERLSGTDPADAESVPRAVRAKGECPWNWYRRGALCFSGGSSIDWTYTDASFLCRWVQEYHGVPVRVASYEDLSYLYQSFPALAPEYNPRWFWIGNIVADDRVLCGNRSITSPNDGDIDNFEGTCNKTARRRFWCVLDLGLYEATH
jgi:hypothetical protein